MEAIRTHCKGVSEILTPSTVGIQTVKYIKLTADMTRTLDEDEKDMDTIHILGGSQITTLGGTQPIQCLIEEDNFKHTIQNGINYVNQSYNRIRECILLVTD